MSPVRIFLSASFPACLFSFVRGSDISLPPRILLRRRASCFQPRAFVSCPCPVNVLSVSSQPLLNLLSVSSQPPHIVSLLECIASTHTSSLGVLSAHRRIAVARVAHCMPSLFFPLSVYISPGVTYLSDFDDSSILLRGVAFSENFAAAEPIEKSHFEDPRPDADLKMSLISVISTIRSFY